MTDRSGCRPRPPPVLPSPAARTGSANRAPSPTSPMTAASRLAADRDCRRRTFACTRRGATVAVVAGRRIHRHRNRRWRWCFATRPEVRSDRKPRTNHAAVGRAPTGTAATAASCSWASWACASRGGCAATLAARSPTPPVAQRVRRSSNCYSRRRTAEKVVAHADRTAPRQRGRRWPSYTSWPTTIRPPTNTAKTRVNIYYYWHIPTVEFGQPAVEWTRKKFIELSKKKNWEINTIKNTTFHTYYQ